MMHTCQICGTMYPVSEYVTTKETGTVPVADVPMMSDYKWQLMCLLSRLQHREAYAKTEDVDAVIAELREWLAAHDASGETTMEV